MTDEQQLLQRALKREPAALAEIYDTYALKIYGYIYRRVGDEFRAEDLTASVFVKMLEAIDRKQFARTALQSWLYRIAHNLIVDEFRRSERRPTTALHEGLALSTHLHPDSIVHQRLENERLLCALDQLTDDQRDVLALRFGEGLTAPQVAEILGKTEEGVRALQRRGLTNLRKLLADQPPSLDLDS